VKSSACSDQTKPTDLIAMAVVRALALLDEVEVSEEVDFRRALEPHVQLTRRPQ